MGLLWETVKALLGSKKFVASMIAALVWVAGKVGLSVDTETMAGIVGPIVGYVLAQGIADNNKEAAKLQAGSASGN